MNTTGCAPGWATDQVLFYNNFQGACDMSVDAWIGITTVLIVLKFITAAGQSYLWYLREKDYKAKVQKQKQKRMPMVPILSWSMFCIYFFIFLLPFYNVANTSNGFSGFVWGIGWLVFGLLSIIFFLKFIRLGSRILPSKARAFTKPYGDSLSKLDMPGQISLVFQVLALIGQLIVLCVVGPIYPNENFVIRTGSAFHAWFTFQHGVSMLVHFERIKKAILQVKGTNASSAAVLAPIIVKLNEQEGVVVLMNFGACILYLLIASGAVEPRYWFITLVLWMDALNFLVILHSNCKSRWAADRRRRMLKQPTTSGGNTPGDNMPDPQKFIVAHNNDALNDKVGGEVEKSDKGTRSGKMPEEVDMIGDIGHRGSGLVSLIAREENVIAPAAYMETSLGISDSNQASSSTRQITVVPSEELGED